VLSGSAKFALAPTLVIEQAQFVAPHVSRFGSDRTFFDVRHDSAIAGKADMTVTSGDPQR
jgi:hypothetical protein